MFLRRIQVDVPLSCVIRLKDITRMSNLVAAPPQAAASTGPGGELFRGFSSITNRVSRSFVQFEISPLIKPLICKVTDRLREGGIGGVGLDNLISGVKNFLPARKDLILTRLVEALMDPASASSQALQDTDDYLLFDPRAGRSARPGAASQGRSRQTFSDGIVFVVGGGSYVEYTNLSEFAARGATSMTGTSTPGSGGGGQRRITYGSTEILSPVEFLKSLGALARA